MNIPKQGRVALMSDKSKRRADAAFPDMDYLGIWHKLRWKAPYVCIEPWTSLPSRQDIIEDIRYKSDVISLDAGKLYQNQWFITVSCTYVPAFPMVSVYTMGFFTYDLLRGVIS